MLFFNYGTARAVHALRRGRAPTSELVHYDRHPAARPAPAARHGVHRALRDPQRLPVVLGPRRCWRRGSTPPAYHPDLPTRFAIVPRRGAERRRALVRGRADLRPALDQRLRGRRRDRPRRLLPGDSRSRRRAAPGSLYERMFHYLALDAMGARPHRWRFNLATGTTKEEDLSDRIMEFGMINGRHAGRRYRYAYNMTGEPGWFLFDGIVKHDLETGARAALRVRRRRVRQRDADGAAPRRHGRGRRLPRHVHHRHERATAPSASSSTPRTSPPARSPGSRLPERISSGTHSCWAPAGALT